MNLMSDTKRAQAPGASAAAKTDEVIKMQGRKVTVHYAGKQALFDVDLDIRQNQVTAPPSGS